MNISKACHAGTNTIRDSDKQKLLSQRISDLSLRIQGSWLEELINKLYQELEAVGITFKPATYLSDEWGCPHGVPVIGIPFYLADPSLWCLESEMTHVEAESAAEVMMYLRHESGHAFNYAYKLYDIPDWEKIFGLYSLPYREIYRTSPFSTRFVRHLSGWYVQKHPDDDFAETFAVWLTPDSQWQTAYSSTPALNKLLYVDRLVRTYGSKPPVVNCIWLDRPVQEMNMTLEDWYKSCLSNNRYSIRLPDIIDVDLRHLLPDKTGILAVEALQTNRQILRLYINNWTGLDCSLLRSLLDELLRRIEHLELKINPEKLNEEILNFSVFATTLAMNYQCTGQFVEG